MLLAAGLLAKKAVEAGLTVKPHIKTSLAPGSRIVTEYLTKAGLLPYLEKLGFNVVGYGCTTCIGNAGDADAGDQRSDRQERPGLRRGAVGQPQLRGAHPSQHQGQLPRHPAAGGGLRASPARCCSDLMTEPVGKGQGRQGRVPRRHLADQRRGRRADEVRDGRAGLPRALRERRRAANPLWKKIPAPSGAGVQLARRRPTSPSRRSSTDFAHDAEHAAARRHGRDARSALFGDSITTDHISPGRLDQADLAGRQWLQEHGVRSADFNSYGARRGNHEVMMRGTFANVRIKNLMLPRAVTRRRRHALSARSEREDVRSTTRR